MTVEFACIYFTSRQWFLIISTENISICLFPVPQLTSQPPGVDEDTILLTGEDWHWKHSSRSVFGVDLASMKCPSKENSMKSPFCRYRFHAKPWKE